MANEDAWQSGIDLYKKKSGKSGGSGGAADNPNLQSTVKARQTKVKSAKSGAKITKGGVLKVHKGEEVLTSAEAKTYRKRKARKNAKRTITKR